MNDNQPPPGWNDLVDVQVGQQYGHWEVYAELNKERHGKPRPNPRGGVQRPRMFLVRCLQCLELKEVKANEIRRYKRGRNPDLVLKCRCSDMRG